MNQTTMFGDLHREPLVAPVSRPSPAIAAARAEGERRKKAGMALAAASKEHLLARARELAFDIARGVETRADGKRHDEGLCTADDVAAAWERDNDQREKGGLPRVPWIGNAAGSLFTDGNWEWTGERINSVRPHAKTNELKLWRRKFD